MKILQCHNFYQRPGGEDQVFAAEGTLMESHGHQVIRYTRHNDEVDQLNSLALAKKTFSNRESYREIRSLIRRERPDVMHCTNIFPLISPSAYAAAKAEGVPVVQTLHNYRLLCPKAQMVRDGSICQKCMTTRTFWPAVMHRCYRGSRSASAVTAAMLATRWALGTWQNQVDRYIALTDSGQNLFIEGGISPEQIVVKPNFVSHDPGIGSGSGEYAIFVGRLSPEKGIETLLETWKRFENRIPLKIIGDGPMAEQVRTATEQNPSIEWLGQRSHDEVLDLIGEARCLVFPSVWLEPFGLSMIEAFAKGTPVVASRCGAMIDLVEHGHNGLHFIPGDADSFADRMREIWDNVDLLKMRRAARDTYEERYTSEKNYELLINIYEGVLNASPAPESELTLDANTPADVRV
ncbi:glycosyltransferase family 4 protein [Thalassoroseus pseudoceratinae]|uniref:glycosyltransferase family 4 protein n=1 Tax=Thalassoroseus pseudoceratinae TaxID=2713176 RepID=UPI00141E858F|nr:glycosyltransferase family 4 protein [Thalassoroseus pseudoceratinae]